MTNETMTENWNDVKDRVRAKWSNLTDRVLEQSKDSKEKLVSTIQRMTGESRDKINEYLDNGAEMATDFYSRATEAVQVSTEQVQEGVKYARESFETGKDQAEKLVQARPVESLLATFAVGVVAGLAIEMVFRSKPTHASMLQSHFNNLQNQLPQMPSMASLPTYQGTMQAFNKFMKDHFNCA